MSRILNSPKGSSKIPPPPPLPPPLTSASEPIRRKSSAPSMKKSAMSKKGSIQEQQQSSNINSKSNWNSNKSISSSLEAQAGTTIASKRSSNVSGRSSTGSKGSGSSSGGNGSGTALYGSGSGGSGTVGSGGAGTGTNPTRVPSDSRSISKTGSPGRLSHSGSGSSGGGGSGGSDDDDDNIESGSQGDFLRRDSDDVYTSPNPELNDVPFFDEDACTDEEDEFNFPCCVPPYSPRYPPNPRPIREWDPCFLPQNTSIPTSIGALCRRCGREVYLAELHLSSRGVYHTECYKCCLCGKSLDSWSVMEYKGEVFCKGCYRRNFAIHGVGFGVGAGVLQTP